MKKNNLKVITNMVPKDITQTHMTAPNGKDFLNPSARHLYVTQYPRTKVGKVLY